MEARALLRFAIIATLFLQACAHSSRYSRNGQDPSAHKANACMPVSSRDRREILRLANPNNFPNARYKKRWNEKKPIEQETDCSKFVHEIYRRAGLFYPRATVKGLASEFAFKRVDPEYAKPGDLVVFPKHVGILANDGDVISATQGGPRRKLATRSNRDPRFRPSVAKTPKEHFSRRFYYLQYQCRPEDVD